MVRLFVALLDSMKTLYSVNSLETLPDRVKFPGETTTVVIVYDSPSNPNSYWFFDNDGKYLGVGN